MFGQKIKRGFEVIIFRKATCFIEGIDAAHGVNHAEHAIDAHSGKEVVNGLIGFVALDSQVAELSAVSVALPLPEVRLRVVESAEVAIAEPFRVELIEAVE